jgi:hypothetical protein
MKEELFMRVITGYQGRWARRKGGHGEWLLRQLHARCFVFDDPLFSFSVDSGFTRNLRVYLWLGLLSSHKALSGLMLF